MKIAFLIFVVSLIVFIVSSLLEEANTVILVGSLLGIGIGAIAFIAAAIIDNTRGV